MIVAFIVALVIIGSVIFHMWSPWWWSDIASNWIGMDNTILLTFWITGAVFVAVGLFTAYCIWKYKYNKNRRAEYEPENAKTITLTPLNDSVTVDKEFTDFVKNRLKGLPIAHGDEIAVMILGNSMDFKITKTIPKGIIKIDKSKVSEDNIFELTVDSGANECFSNEYFHEIQCNKNEIYNVKKKLERNISNFLSTEIEWIPLNKIELSSVEKEEIVNFLGTLDDDDDVQNVYTNAKL